MVIRRRPTTPLRTSGFVTGGRSHQTSANWHDSMSALRCQQLMGQSQFSRSQEDLFCRPRSAYILEPQGLTDWVCPANQMVSPCLSSSLHCRDESTFWASPDRIEAFFQHAIFGSLGRRLLSEAVVSREDESGAQACPAPTPQSSRGQTPLFPWESRFPHCYR